MLFYGFMFSVCIVLCVAHRLPELRQRTLNKAIPGDPCKTEQHRGSFLECNEGSVSTLLSNV